MSGRRSGRARMKVIGFIAAFSLNANLMVALPGLLAGTAAAAVPPPGSAGALDSSWGASGLATVAVAGSPALVAANRVLVLSDGSVIVAGAQPGQAGSVVVAKLTPSGTLDPSFGSGGLAKPGLGAGATPDSVSLALQPTTGDIIVGSSIKSGSVTEMALKRLTPSGSVDATFGSNGVAATSSLSGFTLLGTVSLAVSPSGAIAVIPRRSDNGDEAIVLQYSAGGVLNASFGSNGVGDLDTEEPPAYLQDLTYTADGHLLAVGYSTVGSQSDTLVARLLASGQVDTTFPTTNSPGFETFDLSAASLGDVGNAVQTDPAGNILVTGTIAKNPSVGYILRLNPSGGRDSTFGANGLVTGTFDGTVGTGAGVAVDGAGRYLVAGGTAPSGSTTSGLGVERLTSGSNPYDPGFGVAAAPGRESISCPNGGSGAAAAVVAGISQHTIVAGACNGSLVVARLNGGNLSNLAMTTSTPQAPAGHGVVPLSQIPNSALSATSASLIGAPGFGSPGFGSPGFGSPGFGSPGFGSPGFGSPGFGSPGFGSPITESVLTDPALGSIPLSEIPLTPNTPGAPASWDAVLAGTSLSGLPTQSVTLQQVLNLAPPPAALPSLTLGNLDLSATSLRKATLGAFLLGTTPISSLPAPGGSWCTFLSGQPDNCSTNPQGTAQSLVDLELGGDLLQSYYAGNPINLVGLAVTNSPLSFLPINDIDMSLTTLGLTLTTALRTPSRYLTCTPSSSSSSCDNLVDAQRSGNLQPGTAATLESLLADSPSAVGSLSLSNLLGGLVSRENLPVENMPLSAIIASSPMPSSGAAYRITFNLGCPAAASLSVVPALPAGFRIIPSTVSMTVGAGSSAISPAVTVNPDGSITPTAPMSCSGTQPVTVNLQAEPSTLLGPTTAGVTVSVSTDSLSLANQAPVQVAKNFIVNDTANPANSATFDTLYAGHIASPGDLDYFSLPAPPAGSIVTVTLSHLPNDDDLVMYGPAVPELRATPGFGSPGFGSPGFGSPGFGSPGFGSPGFGSPGFGSPGFGSATAAPTATFDDSITASHPTLDPDVPRLNLPVRGFSDQRGGADETVTTRVSSSDTTPFLIQISGYNGSWSNQPYVLRISVTPPPAQGQCQNRNFGFTGTAGQLPVTPLPSTTETLLLVDQQRLGAIYGTVNLPDGSSGDAGNVIVSHLQTLAQQPSVRGVVVPVEGDPAVAAAYSAWDSSPCDSAAANQVVSSINALVDRLRAGLPDLRNVVLVGDDEVIPFGRVLDYTSAFNETAFSEVAFNGLQNAESSAAAGGYLLSDNPYGDLAPEPFLSSQLFVPQLAVGRLVETPGDIVGQVNSYVSAGGVTNPASAFVTGYAPFAKGAQQVSATLAADVGASNATGQINDTWSRADAVAGLQSAAHGYAVVNAHYDIYRALPGNGDAANPLSTADLPVSLSGGVEFTIGCHAGLNVPDIYIANPNQTQQAQLLDWPQAELRNGASAYAGNTGYGIGDTDAIAYSERMNSLFAGNLGPAMTIGQAMTFAKQQYVASVGQPSVYDAKAVEESTFYGLPMWRVGSGGKSAAVTLPPPPPSPTSPVTLATTSEDTAVNNFNLVTAGGRGSYYTAGTQSPQVTPDQPIEPLVAVTLPTRTDGLVAHGAIIEQLTSSDLAGFKPVFDTPVADSASFNPEPAITSSDFPSALQSVSGTVAPSGRVDHLDLVAGQFFSDSRGTGTGTQRLYSDIKSTVLSSSSDSYTPPRVTAVSSSIQGSVARFTVSSPDTDVVRGVILMLVAGGPNAQTWQHVELVNAGGGQWVGTTALPAGTTAIGQYFAQLANRNGNVAVSSNKGQDFSSGSVSGFTVSVSPPPDPNTGLYSSPSTVTLIPPAGTTASYTLDGGPSIPYTGPITITGDGGHTLIATATNGVGATFGFPIDASPPSVTISTPANGASYPHGASVTPTYSCTSAVTLVSCEGPAAVDVSSIGQRSYTVTATDLFGRQTSATNTYTVTDAPPTVTVTSGPADGTDQTTATFGYSLSDPDDPASSLTTSCTVDGAPVACGSGSATVSGLAPGITAHRFVVTATDPLGQTGQAVYTWRVFFHTTTTPAQVVPSVPNVSATLTYNPASTGSPAPLPGQTVTFYAGQGNTSGTPLCSAVTDQNGNASCGGLGATSAAAFAGGDTAVYAGSPPYRGSSGSAGVL